MNDIEKLTYLLLKQHLNKKYPDGYKIVHTNEGGRYIDSSGFFERTVGIIPKGKENQDPIYLGTKTTTDVEVQEDWLRQTGDPIYGEELMLYFQDEVLTYLLEEEEIYD